MTLLTAALPIWATVLSTTLVYSSKRTRWGDSASSLASVTRNCCPVEKTWNGLNQAGGDEKPTAESKLTTSLTLMEVGNASRTESESGQASFESCEYSSGQNERAIVLLPHPDGPTI